MLNRLFITICCATLLALPLCAQKSSSHTADQDFESWLHYRLTMPKVDEWAAANQKAAAYMKAHPEVKNKLNNEKDDSSADESFSDLEKKLRAKAPGLVAALESTGLSFREWWNVNLALTVAYTAVQSEKPGTPAPAYIPPENIAFVKAHKQKVATLLADFEKWNKQFSDKQ
jgi:ABC-type glycerol-3-phosphate transport system substrate-binding protein